LFAVLPLSLRTRVAAILLVTLATPLVAAGPAAASPQDDLAQKRAEAQRLEGQIAANGERISILDEQYNQAQLAIDEATEGIAETQRRLDDATQRSDTLRRELAGRAAALYVGAANGSPTDLLDADDIQELGSRSKYGSAAADEDDALIDDLTIAREQLADAQDEYERSLADAEAKRQGLEHTLSDLKAAQTEQEALLADAQGDIAQLVAEIEAQRRREEEAKARAEAERRQQQEAAKRSSTRASASSGGRAAATSARPAPAPNGNAQTAVNTAMAQIGKPYRYAGVGPDSFDCSGLTMYAWAAAGVRLPHSSAAQFAALPHVSQDQLAPGDLVFYGSPIHHVGIYIGSGQYVHAPQTGDVVKVASIHRSGWAGAARPG
jgi:cell wall-associated NlpC family hydrolase